MKLMKPSYIFTILLVCTLSQADNLFEHVVYKKGDNGYNTYRIPVLYETSGGVILAFAEARQDSPSDSGNIDTVVRRSLDGGYLWQAMQVLWNDSVNTCGNPTVVQDSSNGRIWLFMTHNLGQDTKDEIQAGTSDGIRTVWSCYSDNDGASWSAPVSRYSEVQSETTTWEATGPGRGLQLTQGSKAGRLVIPANGRNIQSDNHGQTWFQSTWLPSGSSESQIVEIQDGVLLRNDRAVSNKELNARVFCRSYNQGLSWTPLQFRTDLTCPICQASTIVVPESSSVLGRMLVFSNPSAVTRVNMTVQCSYDDGINWPVKKKIYPDLSGYSCLSPIGGDHLGLLYENGDNELNYKRITFARFSRSWLRDPAIATWDFKEYQNGQFIRTAPGMVKDSRGYGLDATSDITFAVVAGAFGNSSAVRFIGDGSGIRLADARKIINFNAADSFSARVIFRTTSHCGGGISSAGALVAKDAGTGVKSWWLRVQDGRLRFLVNDGTVGVSVWSTSTVCDGLWYEVIASRDASSHTLKMYVNGRLEGQTADNTTEDFINTNPVSIGCFNDSTKPFKGDIAKVQLYRTSAENIVSVFDGDIDGDCVVDIGDLFIMSTNWLDNSSPEFEDGDVDTNGNINAYDFAVIAKNWLKKEY